MSKKEFRWQVLFLVLGFSFLTAGCPQGMNGTPDMLADGGVLDGLLLTSEELAGMDALEGAPLNFDNVVLPAKQTIHVFFDSIAEWNTMENRPDYRGTDDINMKINAFGHVIGMKKNYLIGRLVGRAVELADRSRWQHPSEGGDAPAQNGIGYLFGSTDYTERGGSGGPAGVCPERLYGLDTLGYINHIWSWSQLFITGQTADGFETSLNSTFSQHSSWGLEYKPVNVGNASLLATGDVVFWKNHLGLIAKTMDGETYVLQNHGSPLTGCQLNYSEKRGPRAVKYSDITSVLGAPRKIYRLSTTLNLSGTWQGAIRCVETADPFFSQQISVDGDAGSNFDVSQLGGTASDGTPLKMRLFGEYSVLTDVLSGQFHVTNAATGALIRMDDFNIELRNTDTGYFNMHLNEPTNGSVCFVEIKWVKVSDSMSMSRKRGASPSAAGRGRLNTNKQHSSGSKPAVARRRR